MVAQQNKQDKSSRVTGAHKPIHEANNSHTLYTQTSHSKHRHFYPLKSKLSQAASIMRTDMLLIIFVLVTTLRFSSQSNPSFPEIIDQSKVPDNETIYRVSKQLCWGCVGEALQFLFAHNLVRAAKWEFPLMWDFQLQRYANWWAEQRKADCKLHHSFPEGGFKLGENIYWGSGSGWTPSDAVSAWAGEEKYYDYGSNSCETGKMCGHYTQIVWRSTRRIGCARVVCNDGDLFMTCNYDPVGNYEGQRPY